MDEWFSHFLTQLGAKMYDEMQMLRPDYCAAMDILRREARLLIRSKSGGVSVLDVACGTAMATRVVFNNMTIPKQQEFRFVGLDVDKQLSEWARQEWPSLNLVCANMTDAVINEQFDLLLCSFAYHHVPDAEKPELCKKLRTWCKPAGDLLVLEICLEANQLRPYYEAVKSKLKRGASVDLCRRFMDWTMTPGNSCANSEWKVPLTQVMKDFSDAGWQLQTRIPLWGIPSLPNEAGCYYLHFRLPDKT